MTALSGSFCAHKLQQLGPSSRGDAAGVRGDSTHGTRHSCTARHAARRLGVGHRARSFRPSFPPLHPPHDTMEYWRQCAMWLISCNVLPPNHRVTSDAAQVFDLAQTLRDGVLLCQLLNNLRPHTINLKEINLRPQMSQVGTGGPRCPAAAQKTKPTGVNSAGVDWAGNPEMPAAHEITDSSAQLHLSGTPAAASVSSVCFAYEVSRPFF